MTEIFGMLALMCIFIIWIVNQMYWYKLFQKHFDSQAYTTDRLMELNDLHKVLIRAQLRQMAQMEKIDHNPVHKNVDRDAIVDK